MRGKSELTSIQPIIRYDAIIEAWLDGTLGRTFAADDKRAAAESTTLRKTIVPARAAAVPSRPSVLVNGDEANLLARQARQRVEHAERKARNGGIALGTGGIQKRATADANAVALFSASRLRRIAPGF